MCLVEMKVEGPADRLTHGLCAVCEPYYSLVLDGTVQLETAKRHCFRKRQFAHGKDGRTA